MKTAVKTESKFNQKVFIVCLFFIFLFTNHQAKAQWTPLASGVNDDLYGIYFLDSTKGYAVGWGSSAGAVVLKTTNGGEN